MGFGLDLLSMGLGHYKGASRAHRAGFDNSGWSSDSSSHRIGGDAADDGADLVSNHSPNDRPDRVGDHYLGGAGWAGLDHSGTGTGRYDDNVWASVADRSDGQRLVTRSDVASNGRGRAASANCSLCQSSVGSWQTRSDSWAGMAWLLDGDSNAMMNCHCGGDMGWFDSNSVMLALGDGTIGEFWLQMSEAGPPGARRARQGSCFSHGVDGIVCFVLVGGLGNADASWASGARHGESFSHSRIASNGVGSSMCLVLVGGLGNADASGASGARYGNSFSHNGVSSNGIGGNGSLVLVGSLGLDPAATSGAGRASDIVALDEDNVTLSIVSDISNDVLLKVDNDSTHVDGTNTIASIVDNIIVVDNGTNHGTDVVGDEGRLKANASRSGQDGSSDGAGRVGEDRYNRLGDDLATGDGAKRACGAWGAWGLGDDGSLGGSISTGGTLCDNQVLLCSTSWQSGGEDSLYEAVRIDDEPSFTALECRAAPDEDTRVSKGPVDVTTGTGNEWLRADLFESGDLSTTFVEQLAILDEKFGSSVFTVGR